MHVFDFFDEILEQHVHFKNNDVKISFFRDFEKRDVQLIVRETIANLYIHVNVFQKLFLRFINCHRECKANKKLTFDKLTKHYNTTIFVEFVIFKLQ